MNAQQFLLADVGNDRIGQTKTFLTVTDSHPVGAFSIKVSTTYSKAKDPDAHLVRLQLHIADKDKLLDLAKFLAAVSVGVDYVDTLPI
jgi:hypothetical protein